MAGRPRQYDETEIIDRAIGVFWKKPYDAASADELLDAMGIGKGSFYLKFRGGKKELYERSLKHFAARVTDHLRRELAQSEDPVATLQSFFLTLVRSAPERRSWGCYIGNALMQFAATDGHTAAVAASLLGELHTLFTGAIRKAQQEGRLPATMDAALMGWHLVNLWNGLNVTARTGAKPKLLRELIAIAFRALQ